ncbi:hypothetical protein L6R49_29530 [Myxococcota bacterium]|nr:hypothetical protein [Myxococcota bacterium]
MTTPRLLPVFFTALALSVALTFPLALHLGDHALDGAYWGNQAWSVRVAADALWEGAPLTRTREAGWPVEREVRHLGWVILALGALLRPLGAATVLNLSLIFGPALTATALVALLRRLVPQAGALALTLAGLTYAFSPHFVANLGNAEAAKAQTWLVPLTLLWALKAAERWRALPVALGVGAALTFTEPYGLMVALFVLPFLALGAGRREDWPRWAALGAGLIAVGLLGRAYFTPGGLELTDQIYLPSSPLSYATERMELPASSATLQGLLYPDAEAAPSGTQHGVYLTWSLVLAALVSARRRDRVGWLGLGLAAAGVLAALGPILFWTRERSLGLWLPMMLAERLHLPIASGGMYYRLLHVALLGLALCVARLRWRPWAAALFGLGFTLELVMATAAPLPLPTAPLPFPTLAAALRDDPQPGAVMTLPGYPPGTASKEWSFRLAALHGRPTTDLPRRPSAPFEWPPFTQGLDRCLSRPTPCEVPTALPAELGGIGVRALTLREGDDTQTLRAGLTARLGEPTCAEGLCLWWLDAAPPDAVPSAPRPQGPPRGRGGPPQR